MRRAGLDPGLQAPLPAPVLRRPAPAHRHRPRAGGEAATSSSATRRWRRWTCRSRRRSSTCSWSCARELDLTYLFISHDLGVVEHLSDRVVIMYLGRVVEEAPTEDVFAAPNHPYTQALLAEVPRIDAASAPSRAIKGEIPSPLEPAAGLPLPSALPACDGTLPGREAGAQASRPRPAQRLPPERRGLTPPGHGPAPAPHRLRVEHRRAVACRTNGRTGWAAGACSGRAGSRCRRGATTAS